MFASPVETIRLPLGVNDIVNTDYDNNDLYHPLPWQQWQGGPRGRGISLLSELQCVSSAIAESPCCCGFSTEPAEGQQRQEWRFQCLTYHSFWKCLRLHHVWLENIIMERVGTKTPLTPSPPPTSAFQDEVVLVVAYFSSNSLDMLLSVCQC